MTFFKVSFQYSERTFCTNIAHAETAADVEKHYSKYAWSSVEEATPADVEEATRKGMPIVEIESTDREENKEMTETTYTMEEAIDAIIAYFEENEDEFNETIEEMDSYDGYLGDDRYYNMEDLDEFYSGQPASEILTRAFYGHDAETWTTDDHGNKTYGEFNPNREYFYYNGYGNLVSADYKDYSAHLDKWFAEKLIDLDGCLDSVPDDVQEIIDSIEA